MVGQQPDLLVGQPAPGRDQVGTPLAASGPGPGPAASASTRPWSPERSTSGTSQPRNSAGRVYCGYSSSPAAKLSSSAESLVAQHAGQQAGHRLHHHQGGQLAPGQHEVADRQLAVAPGGRPPAGRPPRSGRTAARTRRARRPAPGPPAGRSAGPTGDSRSRGRGRPSRDAGHLLDRLEHRLGGEHHARRRRRRGRRPPSGGGRGRPSRMSWVRRSSRPPARARPRIEAAA